MTSQITVTILAVPFTGARRQRVKVLVDSTGAVRVWDSVAKHYTRCHALTEAEMERARAKTRAAHTADGYRGTIFHSSQTRASL